MAGVVLALSGFVGTSALAAVTALHVHLEHHAPRDTAGLSHRPDARAADDHAHPHEPEAAVTAHSHTNQSHAHRAEAPEHDHVLVLAADLCPRSDRLQADPLPSGAVDATLTLALAAVPPPPPHRSRAGPSTRAVPLSRRSVVLKL